MGIGFLFRSCHGKSIGKSNLVYYYPMFVHAIIETIEAIELLIVYYS